MGLGGGSSGRELQKSKGGDPSPKGEAPSRKFQVTSHRGRLGCSLWEGLRGRGALRRDFLSLMKSCRPAERASHRCSKSQASSRKSQGRLEVFPCGRGAVRRDGRKLQAASCKFQGRSGRGGALGLWLGTWDSALGAGPDLAECRLRGDRVVAARSFRLCHRGSGARLRRPGCRAGLRPGLRAVGRR
jgi:hypothetical protein